MSTCCQEEDQTSHEWEGSLMYRSRARMAARRGIGFVVIALALLIIPLYGPAPSSADLHVKSFSSTPPEPGGGLLLQSSRHPDQTVATFEFDRDSEGRLIEAPRDISVDLPPGAVGNTTAVPTCPQAQFAVFQCPNETVIGVARADL